MADQYWEGKEEFFESNILRDKAFFQSQNHHLYLLGCEKEN